MSSNAIHWFENPAFDAPELKSPQPCIHGAGCVYTIKNAEGKTVPGVCHFVHPGEEGKGRRLFPERMVNDAGPDGDGKFVQPACVRLIGRAGFYERMRLRMPWQAWCERSGIPFTPNTPGVFREPVRRIPIGGTERSESVKSRVIHHICTAVGQDYLVAGGQLARISPEEAVRLGYRAPAKPVSAAPDRSWPVMGSHTAAAPKARIAVLPPLPPHIYNEVRAVAAAVVAAAAARAHGH
jgi:hypothetical protein